MRDKIRDFVLGLGVDDVGIAAAKDYKSRRSSHLQGVFPEAKSLVVLAYQERAPSVSGLNLPKAQLKIEKKS